MWVGALGLKGTSVVAGEGQGRALSALSLSLRVPGRNSGAEAGGHSPVQVLAAVATWAPFPATAHSPLLRHPFLRGVLPEGPVGQEALGRAPQAPSCALLRAHGVPAIYWALAPRDTPCSDVMGSRG